MHSAARDTLAHMVKQCGLTDAAVVETPVTATSSDTTVANMVCFDRGILEVQLPQWVPTLRQPEPRTVGARTKSTRRGNNKTLTPIALSSGAMGLRW